MPEVTTGEQKARVLPAPSCHKSKMSLKTVYSLKQNKNQRMTLIKPAKVAQKMRKNLEESFGKLLRHYRPKRISIFQLNSFTFRSILKENIQGILGKDSKIPSKTGSHLNYPVTNG